MAERSRDRLRLPLEAFEAVRASVGARLLRRLAGFLAEECIEGGNGSRKRPPWASPSRPQGWISVRLRLAESSRTRAARPSCGCLSLYRAERLPIPIQGRAATNVCLEFISDARGLFGRNAAPTRVIATLRGGVWHAGRLHGWRAQLRNGGELARGGSLRRRRRSAVVPRRSRRDAKDLARPRRGSAHLASTRTIARCSIKNTRWLPANSGTSSTSTPSGHCIRRTESGGSSRRIGQLG